jgi:PPOX class probable FMN-dependent enzyme
MRTAADDYQPIDIDRIRDIIGYPPEFIANKVEDHIGDFAHRFIAHSTFFVMASIDNTGSVDASPKGDPPGSLKVLDPWTLAIPDRPGNRAIDTFRNLMTRPGIGLVLLVPGLTETLRINGDGFVTDDPDLLAQLEAGGKPAVLATVLRVKEVFFQCGKALVRSHMWDPNLELAQALTTGAGYYTIAAADMGVKLANAGIDAAILTDIAKENERTSLF